MNYNIIDIAFEQIKDNYYWGKYGDFKVIINISTGYINATHLCGMTISRNGLPKQFGMWKQNINTNELINEVSIVCGIPQTTLFDIVQTGLPNEIRGTYVHADLIPHIASWASPKFAVKVSKIVNAHLVREYKESIRAKDQTIDRLERMVAEIKAQNDEQTQKLDEQSRQIRELLDVAHEAREETHVVQEKLENITVDLEDVSADNIKLVDAVTAIAARLDIATEDRVPKHPIARCNEVFAVYHKPNTQQYKMVRRQKNTVKLGLDRCRAEGFTEKIFYSDSPNAVNLGNRFKDVLPRAYGRVSGCNITLQNLKCAKDLVDFIASVEAEKKNV